MATVGPRTVLATLFVAASTASIASSVGTSESQLVRYFDGKAGLLEETFNMGWSRLNQAISSKVVAAPTGQDALIVVMETMSNAFQQDE